MTTKQQNTEETREEKFFDYDDAYDYDYDYDCDYNRQHKSILERTRRDKIMDWVKIITVVGGVIVTGFLIVHGTSKITKWGIRSIIAWAERK
ncbi:hypothetical protein IKF15_03890 [Candidatus Saccharibacteria bacterium]|nr:hypothetical protein [Candidatus Saccharibacteria bacterium]